MDVNINVKRRYKINGREYASLEEMPPEIRALVEKATQMTMGEPGMTSKTKSKIVLNGTEYNSPDEMPANARSLYEQALKAAEVKGAALPGSARTEQAVTRGPHATLPESSFSARSVIMLALVIGLLALAYYLYNAVR